jgi:hypothetical protein
MTGRIVGWIYFAVVQIIALVAMVIGWFLLIPFCLAQSYGLSTSVNDGRLIDTWRYSWLQAVYGNPEDGVSGRTALIWLNGVTQGPYMPDAWAPWRAYCWSAWRNSADNLKYVFAWNGGPFYRWANSKYFFQAGWNASGAPVLSAGRIQ